VIVDAHEHHVLDKHGVLRISGRRNSLGVGSPRALTTHQAGRFLTRVSMFTLSSPR
jgi:hypothetical protein